MTSLSGEFQTDLGIDDAMVACTEAIDGIGWRIDTVDAQRVIAYTDSGEHPPRIEVGLNETGGGTEFRIIGSDNEQNQLEQDDLIAILDKARDAINRSMEDAERPSETSPSSSVSETQDTEQQSGKEAAATPAGWYPDVYDDSRQRYWDGEQWTDDFRPADSAGEPEGKSKPEGKSRKEARTEKREQSRERAEQRRQERLEKRQERAQQSGAAAGGAAAGGAAAGAAAAGDNDSGGGGNGRGGDGGNGPGRDEAAPQESPESATPAPFRSLHLIASLYRYLGYLVVVGGAVAVIAAAANAGGGDAVVTLILGAIGVAFYALLVFGIAAAIRLALAVEKNTRDTAELLKRRDGNS